MRKFYFVLPPVLAALVLSGCSGVGDKSASLSVIYGATAFLSLLLLGGYWFLTPKKEPWFLLLFSSILIVNVGYFFLAISRDLSEALWANRISYLGSVFLPLSMWMVILKCTGIPYRKWLAPALLVLAAAVFLIAASPGYLDIYYKEVFFEKVGGVTVLRKVYGPLHGLYLVYLLGYFGTMVAVIGYVTLRKKLACPAYAAMLASAVFVNLGVWLIEQLVQIDFEFLSVSYIISGLFLLGLDLLQAETQRQRAQLEQQLLESTGSAPAPEETAAEPQFSPEQLELFAAGMERLTPKEREICNCYVAGMTTAQIMEQLSITENTLKFHNKNLYGKLGVKSRKQLTKLHAAHTHEG